LIKIPYKTEGKASKIDKDGNEIGAKIGQMKSLKAKLINVRGQSCILFNFY